eukprot:1206407-Prymnesium_polylepis.1
MGGELVYGMYGDADEDRWDCWAPPSDACTVSYKVEGMGGGKPKRRPREAGTGAGTGTGAGMG